MPVFELITLLLSLTALLAYLNKKWLKLPDAIGLMVLALGVSLGLILIHSLVPKGFDFAKNTIAQIDFTALLFDGMLCFMLFAGAFHTDTTQLLSEKLPIGIFAVIGVVLCTALVGTVMYGLFWWLGSPLPYLVCLLFGALISPTDPIAVLGILAEYSVPDRLKITLIGESLFNDGVGVVVFATILKIISNGSVSVGVIAGLFLQEAVGGIIFGLLLGYVLYKLLKSIDHYQTEVMLTLAGVAGGYILAQHLHISGPLAMVVTGLFVGRRARGAAMSDITEEYVDKFWEMLDGILNAILFVLMGLVMLTLPIQSYFWAGAIGMIAVVLLSRYVSMWLPFIFLRARFRMPTYTPILLTWGGLRGGLSIAMALSLPASIAQKDLLVFITYLIVLFSIVGQGLTLGKSIKKLVR